MRGTVRAVGREIAGAARIAGDRRSFLRYAGDVILYRVLRLVPLPARLRTIRLRDGSRITYRLNRGDILTVNEIWQTGSYRPPFPVDRLTTIVDLGANIGLTSVYLARRYGGSVLAVEPSASNVALARRNLAQNGVAGEVVQAAIGPHDGTGRFARHRDFNSGRLDTDGDPVSVLSMATLLARLGPEARIDLVKVDIEGGEAELFSGDLGWLRRVDAVIQSSFTVIGSIGKPWWRRSGPVGFGTCRPGRSSQTAWMRSSRTSGRRDPTTTRRQPPGVHHRQPGDLRTPGAAGLGRGALLPADWVDDFDGRRYRTQVLPALAAGSRRLPVLLAGRPQRHLYAARVGAIVGRPAARRGVPGTGALRAASAWQRGEALARHRVPFVLAQDENLDRSLPAPARFFRRRTLHAALVAARSPGAAALVLGPRAEVVPHPVAEWEVAARTGATARFVVGFAGRLVPEKGVIELARGGRGRVRCASARRR